MTAVMLAVAVMCGTLMGSYQEAQASGIVAGGAIVGTLEEILLSFGIFLLPSSMADSAQNSDWWYSEDGNAALKPYYDDLASEYEKERFKVINGGGGDPQPSPTPVPEQKPEIQPTPVPEVKPGDIPTFDELVAPALAGGAISWASGAWDTMAKAVGNLWDSLIYNHDKINGYTIDNFDQLYADSLGMFQTFDGSDRYCVPFWNLMIILLDLESKGLHLPIQKFILYLKLHILVQKMFLCIVIIFLQNIQKKMVVM